MTTPKELTQLELLRTRALEHITKAIASAKLIEHAPILVHMLYTEELLREMKHPIPTMWWRPGTTRQHDAWHCYVRREGAFHSLCGVDTCKVIKGKRRNRPTASMRCVRCDGAEMGKHDLHKPADADLDWFSRK